MSLRDVIELDSPNMLPALARCAGTWQWLQSMEKELSADPKKRWKVDPGNKNDWLHGAVALQQSSEAMGLVVSAGGAKRLAEKLQAKDWDWDYLTYDQVRMLGQLFMQAFGPFLDEAAQRKLYAIDAGDVQLLGSAAEVFGDDVAKAFPSSCPDLEEACRCLAFGLWTASVVHFMRALEGPLHALQAAAKVSAPKEQWHHILNQIESAISKQKLGPDFSKEDERWFSSAATNFRFIKNAWRNYAAHAHDIYNEDEARTIYTFTKSLMRHLSNRLSE